MVRELERIGIQLLPHASDLIFNDKSALLDLPLVGPSHAYCAAIASLTDINALINHDIDGAAPRSLLYFLLRAATLLLLRDTRAPHLPAAHRAALNGLADLSQLELEQLTAETIDLTSHRLDAWATALATERLLASRDGGVSGCYLGAYSLVDAPPLPTATSKPDHGYVVAPSLDHARTAALLRAGFVARPSGDLAIDLSSSRVRSSKWLLDGMRAGESLAGILGYRVERLLIEGGHSELVQALRDTHPLAAATPRIDGLALHHAWQGNPPSGPLADAAAMLAEVVDALADLLLAESVHQHVLGRPDRAGAVLQALEAGSLVPPDPDVVRSPIRAEKKTWRVMLTIPPNAIAWSGAERRARSIANPELDAWLSSLLGEPTQLGATITFEGTDGIGEVVASLHDLDLAALDVMALCGDRFAGSALEALFARRAPTATTRTSVRASPALLTALLICRAARKVLQGARSAGAHDGLGDVDSSSESQWTERCARAIQQLESDLSDPGGAARIAAFAGAPDSGDAVRATIDRAAGIGAVERVRLLSGPPAPATTHWSIAMTPLFEQASEYTEWLNDLARVRPVMAGIDTIELALRTRGAGLPGKAFSQNSSDTNVVLGAPSSLALVVDTWVESRPLDVATLGIALQHDQPNARAPQAVLIAVCPDPSGGWSFDTVISTIIETFELSIARLVRPHDVTGPLLPALYFSEALDGTGISTNLDPSTINIVMEG